MSQNYCRIGNLAINFDTIQYIERKKGENGFYFHIHFVGTEQSRSINEDTPEGKALLNWWQSTVPVLLDGTDEIVNLYASS